MKAKRASKWGDLIAEIIVGLIFGIISLVGSYLLFGFEVMLIILGGLVLVLIGILSG